MDRKSNNRQLLQQYDERQSMEYAWVEIRKYKNRRFSMQLKWAKMVTSHWFAMI